MHIKWFPPTWYDQGRLGSHDHILTHRKHHRGKLHSHYKPCQIFRGHPAMLPFAPPVSGQKTNREADIRGAQMIIFSC